MPAHEGSESNSHADSEMTSEVLLRQLRVKDLKIERLQQKTKKESGVNKKIRAELRDLKKRALEDSSGSEGSSESEADRKGNKANDVRDSGFFFHGDGCVVWDNFGGVPG